jgi:hypothetical protein
VKERGLQAGGQIWQRGKASPSNVKGKRAWVKDTHLPAWRAWMLRNENPMDVVSKVT